MGKSEKNFAIQKRLFDEIQKNLSAKCALVDIVSEVLEIGSDSAYRRIRCDKLLNIKETYTLCKHFNISFDLLMDVRNIHQPDYVYHPLDVSKPNDYQSYVLYISKSLEKLRISDGSNILMSAVDIPVFHLIYHKELTFFKLYTWVHSVYNYEGSFDDFVNAIATPELDGYYQKIIKDFELTPSTEIWTENTINTTISLIKYYTDIRKFPDKKIPLLLCEQLLIILAKLQNWSETVRKGNNTTPFQLYLSEIEIENTFILLKQSGARSCAVKLFTINILNVFDKDFCLETEKYLTKLTQRSVLLCGSSEKERIRFFNAQQQKVRFLMDKIQKSY